MRTKAHKDREVPEGFMRYVVYGPATVVASGWIALVVSAGFWPEAIKGQGSVVLATVSLTLFTVGILFGIIPGLVFMMVRLGMFVARRWG